MSTQRDGAAGHPRAAVDRSDLISGALSVAVGLAVVPYALTMPEIRPGIPGPGLFPMMIGALFVLFGTALVVKALVVARRSGVPGGADGTPVGSPDTTTGTRPEEDDPLPVDAAGVVDASLATSTRSRWVNAAVVLGGIGFYIVAAELLGFIVTMFVLMLVIMLVLRSKVLPAVLTAAGVTALLYAVFELGLLVQLPDGLLG